MEPGWQPEPAAAVLEAHAGRSDEVLRAALARIRLHSLDRTSPVAERAVVSLRLSLQRSAVPSGRR